MEARKAGVPVVLTPNHHPRWAEWRDPVWHRIYRGADHLFALTDGEAVALAEAGVEAERITVTGVGPVLSPSPTPVEDLRMRGALPPGRYVLFLGQQHKYKRVDVAVEAFEHLASKHDDLSLVIAGPTVPRTRSICRKSRYASRILLAGAVSLADKTGVLIGASVLLFPSEQESFGGVLLEAAVAGTPFVANAIPALTEVQRAVRYGVCVSGGAPVFAEAAEAFLIPSDTARLPDAGALERFSWPSLASRYVDVYNRVATGRGAGSTAV
jgi:glycosyltransferase involved in cell wall biosynthesis